LGGAPHATFAQTTSTPGVASSASSTPRTAFLVVAGVGGEARLTTAFQDWSLAVAAAAKKRFGLPDSLVVVLTEDSTRHPRINGRSSREGIRKHLARLAAQSRAGDRLVILLFGHGASQGDSPRFNVPGPDISAEDFGELLSPLREVSVVFINTTSGSGEFVKLLAGPNRTVISATRSGREQNETIFPTHFVAALTSDAADVDKDGRVNLLEAFSYARREVARVFEQGNRIVTEHPLLDDNGDGVGSTDASEKGPDGLRARTIFFEPSGGVNVAADPRAAALLEERRVVEGRIEALRGRRASMSDEAYQKELEPLLVELAQKSQALRALEGRKP